MKKLGIIGGGQLGSMLCQAAKKLDLQTIILTNDSDAPAQNYCDEFICSNYAAKDNLEKFAKTCDIITFEFENIPLESLNFLEKNSQIFPGIKALKYSQDRLLEKEFISNLGISVAPFYQIKNYVDLKGALEKLKGTAILKTRKFGYDGKGQHTIKKYRIPNIKNNIETNKYIIEGIIKFKKEISVIVIIKKDGSAICYEPSENKHINGILRETVFPAKISIKTKNKAKAIAVKLARSFNIIGIIAIEMFVDKSNEIIVNEVAPRPHNSGHWTMDACNVSQFEALVRVIFDMPIPNIKYYHKCKMINILGENYNVIGQSLNKKNHKVYIYGKDEIKEGRKLGHINTLS